MTQPPPRCVVAYDRSKGTILAVHFLPPGELPPYLTEDHLHQITRSRAAERSGAAQESIATLTTDAAPFAVGNHLTLQPSTGRVIAHDLEKLPAGAAGFASGHGSSAP